MVYGIAGVVIVLLGLLVWLNVYWARQIPKENPEPKRDKTSAGRNGQGLDQGSRQRSEEGSSKASDERPVEKSAERHGGEARVHEGEGQNQARNGTEAGYQSRRRDEMSESSRLHNDDTRQDDSTGEVPLRHGHDAYSAHGDTLHQPSSSDVSAGNHNDETSVEVLQSEQRHSRDSIFGQSPHRYYLNEINVPDFARTEWAKSFTYLNDHAGVLGWIAFSQDTVGAADQKYDDDFLDALRSYRRSTDRLQKQVGLSRVVETSIVGDEGKVWLLTVVDEIWFALFVDRQVDSLALTRELLQLHSSNHQKPF